jgi:hypothetical protein
VIVVQKLQNTARQSTEELRHGYRLEVLALSPKVLQLTSLSLCLLQMRICLASRWQVVERKSINLYGHSRKTERHFCYCNLELRFGKPAAQFSGRDTSKLFSRSAFDCRPPLNWRTRRTLEVGGAGHKYHRSYPPALNSLVTRAR